MAAAQRLLQGTIKGVVGRGSRHLEGGVWRENSATAREGGVEERVAAAAAPVTGPGGPARLRVRADGACSLPTAAIALTAMMGARASGAWQ